MYYDLAEEIDFITAEGYMLKEGLDPDKLRREWELKEQRRRTEGQVKAMDENDVKVKVELEINVPREDWIDYLTKERDIFMTSYSGYWARGVENNGKAWLIYEDCDKQFRHGEEPNNKEALKAFADGSPLPKDWYVLDEAAAIKAYLEGAKRWGHDWFDRVGDANTYDWCIQMAVLGECRYG